MAFPPAHLLVGLGFAEVVRAFAPLPRWRAWAVAGVLAVLPDMDIALGRAFDLDFEYHGTFTHSVVAMIVVAVLADRLGGQRWALLAGASYGSHMLVDLLDARGRTNVLLAWPFSDRYSVAIAPIFPTVPFEKGGGVVNAALSVFEPYAFERLLLQTAIGGVFFLVLLLVGLVLRRLRASG